MNDTNVQIPKLKGIFQNFPQPNDTLFELTNWQINTYTGGWDNHFGYEKYNQPASDWTPFLTQKVDSLFYVQRHQGAQDCILFEQNGTIYQLNDFDGSPKKNELSTSRTVPNTSEIGTQYVQFGRFVIYVNGYDRPSKSHLWPCTAFTTNYLIEYPLGFDSLPPAPVAWNVETDPTATDAPGDYASIIFVGDVYTPVLSVDYKNKGLGIATQNKKNKYRYKISFVNTSGSESPLSLASNTIEWTTPVAAYRYGVVLDMPVGNNDVVARRIYRTKNFSDDSSFDGDTYYYVADVPNNGDDVFIDDVSDSALGSQAPMLVDSTLFPSLTARFVGIYKDCLFLDGGRDNDLVLYYSNPAKPDQYGALSFILLGHRQGGGITGLHSFFNNLLVFREYSIDVIRGDFPTFAAFPLTQHVGTIATNTIVHVPSLGVLFLSYDGIYTININAEYSNSPTVQLITPHLHDTFARINKDALTKASAVSSRKRREYIVHFPIDGSPVNNLGLVYHTDKQVWSVREFIPAGQLIVNSTGDVLFGMNDVAASSNHEHGVMVMSARRSAGQFKSGDSLVDLPPFNSTMRSAWLDMGDSSLKKKIHHVYLFIATGGDQNIAMDYYMDFQYNNAETTMGLVQQRTDFTDQNVYDKVYLDADKYWEEPLVTTVRYDVHSKACSHFQWRIQTNADVHIIGYAIGFTAAGMRVIKGKRL